MTLLWIKTAFAPGDFDTGRQAFHIPFPGPRRSFVEIIDIKKD
jgi:hypothetical protein